MRWAFLGLLLLVSLSLLAVLVTWPGERARTGVSLSEFQNGLRIDRLATSRPDAAPDPHRPGAPGGGQREASRTDSPVFAIAVAQAHAADAPRTGPAARPPAMGNLDNIVAQVPAETQPVQPAGPRTMDAAPRPADPPAALAVPAVPETATAAPAAPPARPRVPARAEPVAATPTSVHQPDHISIHYRLDERSRLAARRVQVKLETAGLRTVDMRTTAHVIAASTVRYFSPQDAPAAVLLAKALATGSAVWRVEDCTAYRHKPEPGTFQLWPATDERHPK